MERYTWDAALASNLAGVWENLAIDVGKEIILPNVTGQQPRKVQVYRQESLRGDCSLDQSSTYLIKGKVVC